MPKRRSKTALDPDSYVPAAELAHSAGVRPEAVAAYAKRRAKRWRAALRHVGGRNYVHINLAERYLKHRGLERRPRRPEGWRTLKGILADSGAGRATFMNTLAKGDLCAVLVKHNICVHPDDAEHFVLNYKNLKPPHGWVMVSCFPTKLGRSKEAVNQWIKRNRDSVEVRRFLHPTRNRPTPYIRDADATRYRAIVATGSEKHVGYSYRGNGKTRQKILAEVVKQGEPVTAAVVATELGFSDDLCKRVLAKLHGEQLLERCGRGVAHHPFRYRKRVHDGHGERS